MSVILHLNFVVCYVFYYTPVVFCMWQHLCSFTIAVCFAWNWCKVRIITYWNLQYVNEFCTSFKCDIVIFYYCLKTQHILISNVSIILHSWQHVLAVNSHHEAKIEQSLGTLKVCTLWDPISFTIVGILKLYVSWYWNGEKLKSVS